MFRVVERKYLTALTLILFITSGMRFHSKVAKLLYFGQSKTCEISCKRKKALKEFRKIVNSIPKDKKIVATTGIIPWNMRPGRYFYHAGEYSQKRKDFDYMILERNHTGFTTPYSSQDVEELIIKCSDNGVIFKDDYFYLAKGPFTPACLEKLFQSWILKPGNY